MKRIIISPLPTDIEGYIREEVLDLSYDYVNRILVTDYIDTIRT